MINTVSNNVMNFVRTRWNALRSSSDAGLTLAEVVVSMAVGTLLLTFVTALTISQIRGVDAAEKRNTASLQVTNALDLMTKELRTAIAPSSTQPAFLAASGETVGFYANLHSLSATAAVTAPYTPQEVWLWTRSVNGKRQLCQQSRALVRDATGALVFPTTSLANETNRTCRVLVDNLAAVDSVPTFTYLRATDDINSATGLSGSTITMNGAAVSDTTTVDAVQVRVRTNAGTARETNVVTSIARVSLINGL